MSDLRTRLKEWFPAALFLLLLLAARSSLADHYWIPSGSMEPTLKPGDRIIVDKRAYGLRLPFTSVELIQGGDPAPGDVVIFTSPETGERLIKRVVAVPGDEVVLRGGHLIRNGHSLEPADAHGSERYGERLIELDLSAGGGPDFGPLRVPAGKLLVLGDARGNSRDSRFFGLLDESLIYAKAVRLYYRRDQGFLWHDL
jgi:signal peptidase I